MVAAAVGTPLIVLGCLAAIVAFGPPKLVIVVGIATMVGIVATVRERANRPEPAELTAAEAPELHAIV